MVDSRLKMVSTDGRWWFWFIVVYHSQFWWQLHVGPWWVIMVYHDGLHGWLIIMGHDSQFSWLIMLYIFLVRKSTHLRYPPWLENPSGQQSLQVYTVGERTIMASRSASQPNQGKTGVASNPSIVVGCAYEDQPCAICGRSLCHSLTTQVWNASGNLTCHNNNPPLKLHLITKLGTNNQPGFFSWAWPQA